MDRLWIEGDLHRCQAVTPSNLATVFAALDAEITIVSRRGERRAPISAFYKGSGEAHIEPNEIIRCVTIPAKAARKLSAFVKLRLWEGDFAPVSAAVSAAIESDGNWRDPRIVLGAVAPVPWRAQATETALNAGLFDFGQLRQHLRAEFDAIAHPQRMEVKCCLRTSRRSGGKTHLTRETRVVG